jgi:hypothetical protein
MIEVILQWSPEMSAIDQIKVYDELLNILAEGTDVARLLAFHLSDDQQTRLDELLDKNRDGTLSDAEAAELDTYERLEHLVRLLKARVLQKQG